jgi:hypothetical protein
MSLPLSAIPKVVASYSTSLSSKIESTDTNLTLESATDDAGNAITGVVALTCEGEYIIGTKSGTSVTGCLRGVDPQDGVSEVSALKAAHNRGTPIKVTDWAFLAVAYRLMNGTEGFPNQLKYVSSGYPTPVNDYDIPTKKYVVDTFAGGSVSNTKLVIAGTAGETIASGNLAYLKVSDGRWWLCDADTAATVDNIVLGIAQGAGTAGVAVTSGVLLAGLAENMTGLSANTKYYASNTAGAVSSSAGTTEVTVGYALSTTSLLFSPRYDQELTEDQQDALAGTSGTPSASNLFVTANDATRNYGTVAYAASAAGTDTYAVTLSPVPAAYTTGMVVRFKADVANTGAATLNVNALGAKSILHIDTSALVDGDIAASSIVTVVYDGTQFLLQSESAKLVGGASSSATGLHTHAHKGFNGTRDMTAASGAVTYAHGLGATPRFVRIFALATANNGPFAYSTGTYDGTSTNNIYYGWTAGPAAAIGSDTTNIVTLKSNNDNNNGNQVATGTVDGTNVTLTWTKGAAPTGTAYLSFEVFA